LILGTRLARAAVVADWPGLGARARRDNLLGSFRCDADVAGRDVALVDDVMTTGATLAEASSVLMGAGAARVECWVVARTPLPESR